MKNQYFGDINDYRKYGLLRVLLQATHCNLLVAWMLTPDDGGGDGRFRAYLKDASYSRYDPGLYNWLYDQLMRQKRAPRVSLIEESSMLPRATYYSEMVPDERKRREEWRKGLFEAAQNADLVFLDPDNGIEVLSKPVGRKGSSKYVTWYELRELWNAGCSLLIYQHFPRKPRERFIKCIASELQRQTGAGLVKAFRTPYVLFRLAAQHRHVDCFQRATSLVPLQWDDQIQPVDLD